MGPSLGVERRSRTAQVVQPDTRWLSGFLLPIVVYYVRASVLMVDSLRFGCGRALSITETRTGQRLKPAPRLRLKWRPEELNPLRGKDDE